MKTMLTTFCCGVDLAQSIVWGVHITRGKRVASVIHPSCTPTSIIGGRVQDYRPVSLPLRTFELTLKVLGPPKARS